MEPGTTWLRGSPTVRKKSVRTNDDDGGARLAPPSSRFRLLGSNAREIAPDADTRADGEGVDAVVPANVAGTTGGCDREGTVSAALGRDESRSLESCGAVALSFAVSQAWSDCKARGAHPPTAADVGPLQFLLGLLAAEDRQPTAFSASRRDVPAVISRVVADLRSGPLTTRHDGTSLLDVTIAAGYPLSAEAVYLLDVVVEYLLWHATPSARCR